MNKHDLHGFAIKHCTDDQLDRAIQKHLDGYRCTACGQPLGDCLVRLGKARHYDCQGKAG